MVWKKEQCSRCPYKKRSSLKTPARNSTPQKDPRNHQFFKVGGFMLNMLQVTGQAPHNNIDLDDQLDSKLGWYCWSCTSMFHHVSPFHLSSTFCFRLYCLAQKPHINKKKHTDLPPNTDFFVALVNSSHEADHFHVSNIYPHLTYIWHFRPYKVTRFLMFSKFSLSESHNLGVGGVLPTAMSNISPSVFDLEEWQRMRGNFGTQHGHNTTHRKKSTGVL